jgi:hypothetical protein
MSNAHRKTRSTQLVHCVIVATEGFPREVRHADEVCIMERVIALTAIILTRFIKSSLSPPFNDANIIFAASGAKKYKIKAAGTEIKRVIKMLLKAFFFAPARLPLAASGDMSGTEAAASPYVMETGRFIIVTAQPEYTP